MKTVADRSSPENALAERSAGPWLLVGAVVVLLPHVTHLPYWLSAVLALLFAWRFFILQRGWPAPRRWLRYAITLLLVALLVRHYGSLFGRDPGSALLATMLVLKLFELQRQRDYIVALFLVYFLILIGFLYSQAPWLVVYLLAAFVLTTASLVRLSVPGAQARFALRLAGVLLLQAVPLMLVMHFLFPRIQGSLWGLPGDAYSGLSGLSEEMHPGDIRELSLSEEIAFRAEFSGALPAAAQRYWRALVLWSTDGRSWKRGFEPQAQNTYDAGNGALRYTLILEPSSKPWLPALDLPANQPAGTRRRAGFVLDALRPTSSRQRFDMIAHTRYRIPAISAPERRATLQLPALSAPRARALANAWRARAADDTGVVNAALHYFHDENFHYTLQPPLLGDDPVDEFLFDTRRGFCEHYASAFVTLMRAAGVPARIVVGYQGGEVNPNGNYLIVRQSDAHAWAEVWLVKQGWVRVDPTAAVAPERIEYGAEALRRLFARGALPGALPAGMLRAALELSGFEQLLRQVRLSWDAVNTSWQSWVLDYGSARQRELLARFGLEDMNPARLIGLLALVVALLLAGYTLLSARRDRRLDPVQKSFLDYCRKLTRAGVPRLPQEGALDFARRCSQRRPDLSAAVDRITGLYLQLRYTEHGGAADVQQLAQLVARFKP
jgi:transglutaminase-like putative cysteine protease